MIFLKENVEHTWGLKAYALVYPPFKWKRKPGHLLILSKATFFTFYFLILSKEAQLTEGRLAGAFNNWLMLVVPPCYSESVHKKKTHLWSGFKRKKPRH